MIKPLDFLFKPLKEEESFSREDFTEEQKEIFKMVSAFSKGKIYPLRKEISKLNKELTFSILREAAELGLSKAEIPEKYGGLGLDKKTSALISEGLALGSCASFLVTFLAHTGIGTLPILYYGNELQKEKYLPKLGEMEALSAYALTEPQAGSDIQSIKTEAKREGEYYIINGTKQFITNGGWAEIIILFAKTNKKDISAFILEKNFGGITTGPEEEKLGIKGSSTTSISLENCRVPSENLLGEEGKGLEIALNILNVGRFKLGSAVNGGCKSCLDFAIEYALGRVQFSSPIAFFEPIRYKIGTSAAKTFALDCTIYRTANLIDFVKEKELEKVAIESSICKIFGSETLDFVADSSLQILGGYGFSEEYLPAQVFRDTRIDRIYEGTNEINRLVIYAYILRDSLLEKIPLRYASRNLEKIEKINFSSYEEKFLTTIQALITYLFERSIVRYGQDLRGEGILGEVLSDFIIYLYATSSAYLRFKKSKRKEHLWALDLFIFDYCNLLFGKIPLILPLIFEDYERERECQRIFNLLNSLIPPYNFNNLVKKFTDYLYFHKKYNLD